LLDSFNACTGPWQYLQRIVSPRSVSASKIVHGIQRPRTFTSHSVITGGLVFAAIAQVRCRPTPPRTPRNLYFGLTVDRDRYPQVGLWGVIIPDCKRVYED